MVVNKLPLIEIQLFPCLPLPLDCSSETIIPFKNPDLIFLIATSFVLLTFLN